MTTINSITTNPKVKISFKVEVPQENWIDFLTQYKDIFFGSYCGYWLRGVDWDTNHGWLVHEHDDMPSENLYKKEIAAWKSGRKLPKGFFRLNKAMAIKAFQEGVKKWGEDWFEDGDAIKYDVVLQLAMLGEIKYG